MVQQENVQSLVKGLNQGRFLEELGYSVEIENLPKDLPTCQIKLCMALPA